MLFPLDLCTANWNPFIVKKLSVHMQRLFSPYFFSGGTQSFFYLSIWYAWETDKIDRKFARHILLKLIFAESLIVSIPSNCARCFIQFCNGLTIICLLFSLRWLPPTLCSPQKIKFGGFKCNLIWETWLELFSFQGGDFFQFCCWLYHY